MSETENAPTSGGRRPSEAGSTAPPPAAPRARSSVGRSLAQFRLRELLLIGLVAAVGLGWWNAARKTYRPADDRIPQEFGPCRVTGRFASSQTTTDSLVDVQFDNVEVRGSALVCQEGDRYTVYAVVGRVEIVPISPAHRDAPASIGEDAVVVDL